MIRFVAIANLRGPIANQMLGEADQAAALASYERGRHEPCEPVVWISGLPLVAPYGYRPRRSERSPQIAQALRRAMLGAAVELGDEGKNERARKRMVGR